MKRKRDAWRRLAVAEAAMTTAVHHSSSKAIKMRVASQLETALRHLPEVRYGDRGQRCLALIAEAREDWKSAAQHRRLQIAYMAFMRELAATEVPLARRAILRDFSPRKVAVAYMALAAAFDRAGLRTDARRAARLSQRWHDA